ncbi:MAG: VIT1/CCC1 transporter family protein [Candidatus Velamenicoccus archaeovorus]
MAERADVRRYLDNLQDEIDSAALYEAMAEREHQPELVALYRKLREIELRHAAFWEDRLRDAGAPVPRPRITGRARVLRWLARRFGPRLVLPTVASLEEINQHMYDPQPETAGTTLPGDERSHARLLRTLAGPTRRGLEGGTLAQLEGRHRSVGGNALRAAVLGANDGLTSNLSLVMGVAGASVSNDAVIIAGLSGLLAGAFSMALGEWISVKSSRELYERQIAVEREEIATIPDEEQEELSLIYQAKGMRKEAADEFAALLIQDQAAALDAMAREELGIDPQELGGSPRVAALTSFVLFALGAVIPLLPFLVGSGVAATTASLVASGVGLFLIGAAITLITGRGAIASGVRQLVLGLAAAGVTYGIGSLVGTALG